MTRGQRAIGLLSTLGFAFLVVLGIACGGGGSREDALRNRAGDQATALNGASWDQLYQFVSPRWKTTCNSQDYPSIVQEKWGALKDSLGLEADAELTIRVSSVAVDGDKGRVFRDLLFEGIVIAKSSEDFFSRWVLSGGRWWEEPEDWQSGCSSVNLRVLPEGTPRPPASPTIPIPLALEPYAGTAHGVTMEIPKGWIVDETAPQVLIIENPTGQARIEVKFEEFRAPLSPGQIEEYLGLKVLQLADDFQEYQELSRESAQGLHGVLVRFRFTQDGQSMGALALLTSTNTRGARALASTSTTFYDFFSPLFEASLKSIELGEAPATGTPTPRPSPTATPRVTPTPIPTFTPGTYTHPQLRFSLQIPPGWGMLEAGKESEVRFIGPGGFIVQVLAVQVPVNMSVAAYARVLTEVRYSPLSGYLFNSQEQVTLGGFPAQELQFDAATGLEGETNRYLVLVTKLGTQAYIIEALGPASQFPAQEEKIRELMTSFRR